MTSFSGFIAKINAWLSNIGFKGKNDNNDNTEESDCTGVSGLCKGYCIEEPPDGGVRAWLVVTSCSVINVLIGILEPAVGFALFRSEEDTGIDESLLTEIYNIYVSFAGVYAPIAFVCMLILGCKWTVHIGSWTLAASFLILSFVKNEHAIKFLLYGLAGIGSSLVQLGVLIPILEYFTSKRIRALTITKVSKYCGQIITIIIVLSGAKPSWQSIYRICMGMSVSIGFIGLTIPTLKSKQTTNTTSFIDRILSAVQLNILKTGLLWLVCTLFFVYNIGTNPPKAEFLDGQMPERLGIESSGTKSVVYGLLSSIGLIIGAILAWIFKVSAGRKFYGCMNQTPTTQELFNVLLMLMVGIPVLMAVMCFIAPEVVYFSYFLIFTLLFSAQLAFIEELRDDMLPDMFGQANVKLVEGLIQMFISVGGLIASTSAADLHWKNSFRMGGGLLVATSVLSIGILLLRFDVKSKIMKVKPTVVENTENSYQEVEPSSSQSKSETSEDTITASSGEVSNVSQIPSPDVLQKYNLKYKSKTTYGPSNMKFVIPRKKGMYGSRETSIASSEGSVENISPDFNHSQDLETHATGRTVYTDLITSRSPDSYGIIESKGNKTNGTSRAEDYSIKPSQYNVLYSYNITQNMNDDMKDIDLL